MSILVTEAMKEAGSSICDSLMDAQVRSSMGGLGGCEDFEIEDFPENHRDLITKYLSDRNEVNTVTAIYIVMEEQRIKDKNK